MLVVVVPLYTFCGSNHSSRQKDTSDQSIPYVSIDIPELHRIILALIWGGRKKKEEKEERKKTNRSKYR